MVKASTQITLNRFIDLQATYQYYLLQSSTLEPPSKPATFPPSSEWGDSEPEYVEGTNNSLYRVDCVLYSDNSFTYSEVSLSTSYEAAKLAYNIAHNAQESVDKIPSYVASRGENLITNGTCLLGDNTNFTYFTYDGSETYYAGGSFKSSKIAFDLKNDEFIPVEITNKYKFSYWIKCDNGNANFFDLIDCYDIDKMQILPQNVMWIEGSTTTLAQDLKNGDTTVYLTDVSGFNTTTTKSHQRGLIFWNYANSKGHTYPEETYSRNIWENLWSDGSAIDAETNTITLDSPWSMGTFPAGTSVSQSNNKAKYVYLNNSYQIPENTWTQKQAYINGVGRNEVTGKFREGTAFIKVGWLGNRDVSSCTTWISTISFTQCASTSELEVVRQDLVDAETSISKNQNEINLRATTETVTEISNNVNELDKAIEEANILISENKDAIATLTARDFKVEFTSLTNMITNLEGDLSSYKEEVGNWMRFDADGNLVLGATRIEGQDAYELKLTKNRISFVLNDSEVAYISSNQLYITNSTVVQNLKIGGFTWEVRGNGNLGLVYR